MSEKVKKSADFENLAILPVRDTVLFPNAILPLTVGRESSLELINSLLAAGEVPGNTKQHRV